MELPHQLRLAIERELRGTPAARLSAASAALSERYRAGHGRGGRRYLGGPEDAAAYAAYRMPATFAALAAALGAAAARMPGWAPASLLDAGAGSGAALWAAAATWPGLQRATMLEGDRAMADLGRRLAAAGRAPALAAAEWRQADLAGAWEAPPHDLVTAAYVLGELAPGHRGALVDRLWGSAGSVLLLVEPGTPAGWAIIRAAREQLAAAGAWIVAPCPHQRPCPLPADDWCHFSQRLARPPFQRAAKGAERGHEDEKFSYIAVARSPGSPIAARVLRHPLVRPGRVSLRLCAAEGLRDATVTRADPAAWRQARDLGWGDAIEPEP